MANVYMFPEKKRIPSGLEKELHRVAKEYVETLYAIATIFDLEADKPTYDEVVDMVAESFTEGIYNAIDELDES